MNKKLQATFDDLELQRMQLLKEVGALSHDALTTAPAGKWSILRILSHIVAAELSGLEYVRKKVLGVKGSGDSGSWEEIKLGIFKLSQRLPMLKYKAPKAIEDRTVVYNDLKTVELEWGKLRAEWRSFLEALPEEYGNRKIFRHVIGGRFNVQQGLSIFREHIGHHLPQIRVRMGAR